MRYMVWRTEHGWSVKPHEMGVVYGFRTWAEAIASLYPSGGNVAVDAEFAGSKAEAFLTLPQESYERWVHARDAKIEPPTTERLPAMSNGPFKDSFVEGINNQLEGMTNDERKVYFQRAGHGVANRWSGLSVWRSNGRERNLFLAGKEWRAQYGQFKVDSLDEWDFFNGFVSEMNKTLPEAF